MPKTIKYIGTQVRWPELAVTGKQSTWNPGRQDERSDAEADLLLGTGLFLTLPPLATGGGIAYATLASTPGQAAGERRTLSDGPDAGAELIWSIPEGASAYAWCWAIYPLASYL